MWTSIARFILRSRRLILIVLGAITCFMLYNIPHNEVSYDLSRLLPVGDSTAETFEQFKKRYGANDNVYLVSTEDSSLFQLEKFQKFYEFNKKLSATPAVDSVFSIATCAFLEKNRLERRFELVPQLLNIPTRQSQIDSLRNNLYHQPFYERILFMKDSDISIMAIVMNSDSLATTKRNKYVLHVANEIDAFSKEVGIKFTYSGMPYIRAKLSSQVEKEILLFIGLAAALTALLLYFFLRAPRAVIVSLLVVAIAVIWLFGTLGFLSKLSDLGWLGTLNFKINVLTSLIPPLVIVIGIPNCIFLLNKYFTEYKEHRNQAKALTRVIQKIGNATFMTNATTAAGFATFVFASSDILIEFGIISSIAILSVFVLSITLLPIIYSYITPPKEKHYKHLDYKWTENLINWFVNVSKNYRGTVYLTVIALAGVAGYGLSHLDNNAYVVDDIRHDDPVMVDLKYYESTFNGVVPFEILITSEKKGGAIKLSTLKKVDQLYDVLENYEELSRPVSLLDVIKYSKQAFYNGDPDEYSLPLSNEIGFIYDYASRTQSSSSNFLETFVDSNKQQLRISLQMKDVGTQKINELTDELRPKIEKIFKTDKYTTEFTGIGVMVSKGVDSLVSNLILSLLLTILIIATMMGFMFRNFRMVMISLIPNILPLFVTAAIMGYFGIAIKPSTILVFSIAFGISIDDTIHFLAKYRQELYINKGDIKKSVTKALKETGLSMFYTSIVLFFGFGIFTVSDFGGTKALGVLVSLTLLVAMLSNLILLPCLLLTLDKLISIKELKNTSDEE